MQLLKTSLLLGLLHVCSGYHKLKSLSYTQLPTSVRNGVYSYTGPDLGAATDGAYDSDNHILYVVGATPRFMHVIDVSDPSNPSTLLTHEFLEQEGNPYAVDACGDEVAVSLTGIRDQLEGHVRFFKKYARGSGVSSLQFERFVSVAMHPKHLKYTRDCSYLVVSNEGRAKKNVLNQYNNPEGSVSIIHGERTGNPTTRLVDFQGYNIGEQNYNPNIRVPALNIPSNLVSTLTTVAEDIEPEYVTISNDGRTAWVSLQENDAIAEVSITGGVVNNVHPLSKKTWDNVPIDVSDRDGGVHRREYPRLKSMRMPGVIKQFQVGNKKYLFTADEGAQTTYTSTDHGFTWTDVTAARSIAANIDAAYTDLKNNASIDEYMGRLQVSTIDGKNPFTNKYESLEFFGGRGFSVWDASDMSLTFDSAGTMEEYMEAYDHDVFNTDYAKSTATYQSAENRMDSVSHLMGAQVTGLDVAEDNGTVYLVVGTYSTGTLFLYHVDTSSGAPAPLFQSITRTGSKALPWNHAYTDKNIGDLYISDLEIIPGVQSPTGSPIVYVISTGGGSVSLYEIVEEYPNIP